MNLLLLSIGIVCIVALYFFSSLFIRERDEKRKRIEVQKEFAERERAMQEALSLNRLRLEKEQAIQQATIQKEQHDKKVAAAQQQVAILESQQQAASEYQAKRRKEARLIEQERIRVEKKKQIEQQKLAEQIQEQKQKEQQIVEEQKKLNFCEVDTEYCLALNDLYNKNPTNFQFNAIRALSANYGEVVMRQLERGEAQLSTYEQLSQYIFAFGKMHQEKLRQSFQSIFINNHLNLNEQIIEIIDYGCGQGLGTVCFFDYIKANVNQRFDVSKVILIEPSELALKRAALNIRYVLRSAKQREQVFALHKGIDNIANNDIWTSADSVKIHIFSNILDVENFDIQNLCQKLIATQQGINFFVCVSPNIMNSRNQRLDWFQQYFSNRGKFISISNRHDDIPNPRIGANPWRRYERVFKIDLNGQALSANNSVNQESVIEDDDLPF